MKQCEAPDFNGLNNKTITGQVKKDAATFYS